MADKSSDDLFSQGLGEDRSVCLGPLLVPQATWALLLGTVDTSSEPASSKSVAVFVLCDHRMD